MRNNRRYFFNLNSAVYKLHMPYAKKNPPISQSIPNANSMGRENKKIFLFILAIFFIIFTVCVMWQSFAKLGLL